MMSYQFLHFAAQQTLIPSPTFPNDYRLPAQLAKCLAGSVISIAVAAPLCLPVGLVRFWDYFSEAAPMQMPEASMHEYHLSKSWQHDIWASWKVTAM